MIGHRVQDDGVLVTLKQSWGTAFATLTETQAKRFAWGVLADLDPDGVEKLGKSSAHDAGAGLPDLSRGGPKRGRVPPLGVRPFSREEDLALIKLVRSGLDFEAIGQAMRPKRTRGSIAGRVDRLRRKDRL